MGDWVVARWSVEDVHLLHAGRGRVDNNSFS
jgi:hypothetical protein